MTTTEYTQFLDSKSHSAPSVGIHVTPEAISPNLFPFQREIVRWALRKGRAAIFATTGMGKTAMELEWASHAASRALILAPLAVAQQTVREGAKFGKLVTYARRQGLAASSGITITNYEMLDAFDLSQFGAVACDESSILKAFEGKTRTALIHACRDVPMRLCCTATPAPNDIAEIANHAEFLGVMTRTEMLASFFVHDDEGWRLKGHARDAFYAWLASWGMALRMPSDLGFSDEGYNLPPLSIEPRFVAASYTPPGQLFAVTLSGVTERSAVRKATVLQRVEQAIALVEAEPDEPWLIWVGLNDEGRMLADRMPDAVNVEGSMSADEKAAAMLGFTEGRIRRLISKTSICGFGMNWQHCARMLFVGLSDSYEQYFQAIRRCYRFGQTRPVDVYIVLSDLERPIFENVLRKEREADETAALLVKHVSALERAELAATPMGKLGYEPARAMALPAWLGGAP